MSLYDPSGCSEDGVIALVPTSPINDEYDMTVKVIEWDFGKGGICIEQGDEDIYLDAGQVEELYSILKHNR